MADAAAAATAAPPASAAAGRIVTVIAERPLWSLPLGTATPELEGPVVCRDRRTDRDDS